MQKIKKFFNDNMYIQLFMVFLKLGLFTIGGGMAMVPVLQEKVCDQKGWLSEEETVDCIAVSQALPGVIAINMATYVGHKLKGFRGAVCATIGMVIPSFVIIIMVVLFLNRVDQNPYVQGALVGIRSAATGLIAYAAWKMARQVLKKGAVFSWLVALVAFAAICVFNIDAMWVILAGIVAGISYSVIKGHKAIDEKGEEK